MVKFYLSIFMVIALITTFVIGTNTYYYELDSNYSFIYFSWSKMQYRKLFYESMSITNN